MSGRPRQDSGGWKGWPEEPCLSPGTVRRSELGHYLSNTTRITRIENPPQDCYGVFVTIVPPPDPRPEQRRSQRVGIRIPVLVRTQIAGEQPISEKTNTLEVNAHGALILLATAVPVDQFIFIINPKTGEELQSRVVSLGPSFLGKTQVRIEFIKPAPQFWDLPAPPADWFVALRNGTIESRKLLAERESQSTRWTSAFLSNCHSSS